jgi:hypothetical protein
MITSIYTGAGRWKVTLSGRDCFCFCLSGGTIKKKDSWPAENERCDAAWEGGRGFGLHTARED